MIPWKPSLAPHRCSVPEGPGTEVHRGAFRARSRILSGLCCAVLAVEAPERSGSLITVEHALEQGRDVYAVPGSVFSPESVGCNRLIRDGAGLVSQPWVLSKFNW